MAWQRPTGPDYVTWESLVGSTVAAQQAANPSTPILLKATFVKAITGGKILSLPPGIFEAENGWNNYRPGDTANNYVYGDSTASITTAGMVSYNSGTQQYWNNYIENFRAYLIEIGGDTRRNAVSQVSGDGVGWEMMPWYAQNITICNNVLGPNLQYFQIGGEPSGVDMASAFVKIRGNLSYGNSTGGTSHSGLFRWYDSTVTSILKTWTAAEMAHPGLGFADNALTATLHPTSVEAAALAPSIGEPLPADVAAVLGVPVGIKAIGPVLPAPIPA